MIALAVALVAIAAMVHDAFRRWLASQHTQRVDGQNTELIQLAQRVSELDEHVRRLSQRSELSKLSVR